MVENELQREAFDRYLEMGSGRSIERLHRQLRAEDPERWPSVRTLYEWSRRLDWQRRVLEYERAASAAADEERRRAFAEMERRHVREGLLMQQKGAEYLSRLSDDRVTAAAAVRMLTEGARLERSAQGPALEPPPVDGRDPLLEELSDAELAELVGLVRARVARGEPPGS